MRSILLAAGLGLASAAWAAPLPDATYMHPGQMVPVDGGREINLVCLGHGSPTVLLDSGLATSMRTWRLVHGEIAKVTRTCAYDRAGLGLSDPRSGESDTKAIAADIHALLAAARIKRPILFVGHSMAGLAAVMLQAKYPDDLAGAVLVDPSFANQSFAMTAAVVAVGAPAQTGDALLASFRAQARRARECATLPTPLPDDCFNVPKDLSPELIAALKTQQSRPSYQLTNASETESFLPPGMNDKSLDQQELEAVTAGFGDKPLVVLTSSKPIAGPGLNPVWSAAVDQAWKAGHDRIAALSTRGSNAVVPGSAHNIQHDQPQAVIDAVKKAIAELRAR